MPSPLRRRPRGSAGDEGWLAVPDEARRRVRRSRLTLVVIVSLVVVALGVAIGVLAPAGLLEPSAPSSARGAVGLGLVLVGIATVVVAGVSARRAGALRLAWNSPTATWPRARRRHLLAQVRQDLPVAPEEQADAVAVADLLVRQRAMVPVYGGFALFVLGQSLLATSALSRWTALLGAVVVAAALPFVVRDARRGRTWLAHHEPHVE